CSCGCAFVDTSLVPCRVHPLTQRKAFLTSALVMAALFFLCTVLLFLGVKEQRALLSSRDKVRVSYRSSIKMLVRHVPYQRLVLGFIFSALAFQMSLGNFALFCSHAAGLGAQFQHLLLVLLAAASIAVPVWQAVLVRIGKKATVFIGLTLFIPPLIVIACMPSNLPVFMTMCVVMGFSLATMFLLPWSMLPDVVEDFAVRNPSYTDLEPLFFSCYAFCSKLGGGLSAGISTLTLHFVGYRSNACDHGDGVATALTVLFTPVPITLLLVGLAFFYSYPINERQRSQPQTEPDPEPLEATLSDGQEAAGEPQSTTGARASSRPKSQPTRRGLPLSNSSPRVRSKNHHQRGGVESNGSSSRRKTTSAEHAGSMFVAQSQVNPKWREPRAHPYQQASESKPKNNSTKLGFGSFSDRSAVKSKVTWV
ncbi:sodium-dependent lysophosphatidylcholine symporter 1-like, partial [Lampris incognitus]|uniref:sodium-dependent lysophosphatidylcholine symporter 1-like n=1 Tax=Lampris incognitus TaxID=2546036 RepID=UPI0024B5F679